MISGLLVCGQQIQPAAMGGGLDLPLLQQLIEAASLIADGEDREFLSVTDLRDAQMARSTRWVKA